MARNFELEKIIVKALGSTQDLSNKAMFGGYAWLLKGKLLCAARDDGMLVRLGKGNDEWALAIDGIEPMVSKGRNMPGWVRAETAVCRNAGIRTKLLADAVEFVHSLPV